jgi:Ca2+-binding RTX toxin-like protein
VVAATAVTLLLASGVAWAVTKVGTDGPDTLRGTNSDDNLLGKGSQDVLFGLGGGDNLDGGRVRTGSSAATNGVPKEATRTCWEVPATTGSSAGAAPTTYRAKQAMIG